MCYCVTSQDTRRSSLEQNTENLPRRGARYIIVICNVVTYTNIISCQPPAPQPIRRQSGALGEIATNQSPVFLYFHQTQLTADQGEIEDFEILKYEIREDQH